MVRRTGQSTGRQGAGSPRGCGSLIGVMSERLHRAIMLKAAPAITAGFIRPVAGVAHAQRLERNAGLLDQLLSG